MPESQTETSGPLSDFRVIEWGIMQQGPVAGMMLGDLGAEVIKIEQRGVGDPGRAIRRIQGLEPPKLPAGRNYYFETFNRNKKSLAIDLQKPRAREVMYRLVEKSDVFVQNFRLGVAARLGLDYNTLSRYNPKLVYGNANGWGMEGPDAMKPAYDSAAQGRAGFMLNVGDAEMPQLGPLGLADQLGGSFMAYGILAALVARERTGVGQEVSASLFGGLIWTQQGSVSYTMFAGGKEHARRGRDKAANPLQNFYQCGDGEWIHFAMAQSERYWADFCTALGLPEIANDPRYNTVDKRQENCEELVARLDKQFKTKERAEWLRIFEEQDKLIYSAVKRVADLMADQQAIANKYVTEMDHPVLGKTKIVGPPASFSRTPAAIRCGAPEFGQHTEEILTGLCGYSWEEIAKLKEEEVI